MAGIVKKKYINKGKKAYSGKCSVESYRSRIMMFLGKNDKKLMPLNELESKCRTKNF